MTRIYFLPKLERTISENFEKLIKHKLNKKMFDEILGTENFPFSNYAVKNIFHIHYYFLCLKHVIKKYNLIKSNKKTIFKLENRNERFFREMIKTRR